MADTVPTHHYLETAAEPVYTDVRSTTGPEVTIENGGFITPHHQASVHLSPAFIKLSKHAFMFDYLRTESLFSIGELCDDDYIAIFSKYRLQILKNDNHNGEENQQRTLGDSFVPN